VSFHVTLPRIRLSGVARRPPKLRFGRGSHMQKPAQRPRQKTGCFPFGSGVPARSTLPKG
jgi:hypothetical protein